VTTKEKAVRMISRLPDDTTADQIMARLYVQLKIEKGLKELDAGRGLDHATVRRRLRKWIA
jgi:predicted transcriptional regulator